MINKEEMVLHQGGCHCGKVRFEVKAHVKLRIEFDDELVYSGLIEMQELDAQV